jgi:hypothetical protein
MFKTGLFNNIWGKIIITILLVFMWYVATLQFKSFMYQEDINTIAIYTIPSIVYFINIFGKSIWMKIGLTILILIMGAYGVISWLNLSTPPYEINNYSNCKDYQILISNENESYSISYRKIKPSILNYQKVGFWFEEKQNGPEYPIFTKSSNGGTLTQIAKKTDKNSINFDRFKSCLKESYPFTFKFEPELITLENAQ